MASLALVWDLIAKDSASPVFNKVAVAADRAAVATGRATAETEKASASGSMFGKKAAAALGALVSIDIAAHMIKSAAQFQQSMLLIQTQAGASATEVKKMSSAILGMAGSVGTAPEKLATSLYHIESVGLRGAKALDVLKIAAEGAKVGHADLEQTTNALTSAVASGIPGVQSMSQAMGALNAIVGSGDMNLEQLNEALGTGILTKAKTFGLSLRDVGAALATLGDLNIRGADAATQLRMAFEAMAKQGKPGQAALEGIGIKVNQLRDDMQKGGLNKALLDLNAHLKAAGITGTKVGGFLLDAFSKKGGSGVTLLLSNLARYETKMEEVKKGAFGFGEAWKATKGTASFAFSSLVAEADALGIAIGNKMLPAATAAASWLGTNLPNAFHTLGQIIGPTVSVIGTALVGAWHALLAVLGPVAAALGAVGHFFADHGSMTTGLITGILGMWAAWKGYTIISTAVSALKSGLETLRLRAMYAADGVKNLSASSIAGGAALGMVGLAVAGVSMAMQQNARDTQMVKDATNDYLTALQTTNGAITKYITSLMTQKLATEGVYDAARKYGISQDTVTLAAQGNGAAIAAVTKAVNGNYDAINKVLVPIGLQSTGLRNASRQYKEATTQTDRHTASTNANNNVMQYNIDANGNLVLTSAKAGSALDNTTAAMKTQTEASGILKNALDYLNGVNQSVETSTDAFSIALGNLRNKSALAKDSNNKFSDSLNQNTVVGATNRQMLVTLIDAAKVQAQAVADAAAKHMSLSDALKVGNAALAANEQRIRAAATAAGLNKAQVDTLIGSLGILAKIHANPKVTVDTSQATAQVQALRNLLTSIPNIGASVNANGQIGIAGHGHYAKGSGPGGVPDGWYWTGEQGPELNRKQGSHVTVFSAPQSKRLAGALGMNVPGFASGTSNASQIAAMLASLGLNRAGIAGFLGNFSVESNGFHSTAYNPRENAMGFAQWEGGRGDALKAMAASMGTRWTSVQAQLAYMHQELTGPYKSVIKALRGVTDPRQAAAIVDQQYERSAGTTRGQRENAASSLYSRLASGKALSATVKPVYNVDGKLYTTLVGAKNHANEVLKQAATIGLKIEQKDIPKFRTAVKGAISGAISSFQTMFYDAQRLGVSSSLLKRVSGEDRELNRWINARNATHNRLTNVRAAMNQVSASVQSAVAGSFDITSAGANPVTGQITGAGIVAQQKQALNRVKAFAAGLKKLESKHLNKAYLSQLASAGPNSLPEINALLSLPSLAGINQTEAQIQHFGQSAGLSVARNMYGAQAHQLAQLESREARHANKLAHEITTQLMHAVTQIEKQPVYIQVDGRTILKVTREAEKKANR